MYGIITHNVYHYKHVCDKTSGTDIMCSNISISYVAEKQCIFYYYTKGFAKHDRTHLLSFNNYSFI
jgi:hypothetical protein